MATLSTHTLNSVDGSHAGPIALNLYRIDPDGGRTSFLQGETDTGGRFAAEFGLSDEDLQSEFELVLETGAYFEARGISETGSQICRQTVIRFRMPDPDRRYHIPMMLAPHSYSVWWSGA
ncbi:MAG: hydroxyisourate hydrolase [Pseudomonadota bacterium]